jgi:hypothetical protein
MIQHLDMHELPSVRLALSQTCERCEPTRSRARSAPHLRARPNTRALTRARSKSARPARPQASLYPPCPSRASPHPLPSPQPLRPSQRARTARRTFTARGPGSSRRADLGCRGMKGAHDLGPQVRRVVQLLRLLRRRRVRLSAAFGKDASESGTRHGRAGRARGLVRFGARARSCASSSAAVLSMYAPCVRAQPSAWKWIARRLVSYSRR